MSAFLLVVIYLIFLSLGLPDSTLGSAWPSICLDLGIDEGLQGCVSAIVAAGTIISSLSTSFLNRHLRRYGTVCLSICLTAGGLVCYSYSSSFPFLCLSAIPLGLGAGAIDSTLSDYVANNYKAIHMNVLNAFWGIGALTSPFIISAFLSSESLGWRKAVLCLALIQGVILILSLSIIPVWAKLDRFRLQRGEKLDDAQGLLKTLKRSGVIFAMLPHEKTSVRIFPDRRGSRHTAQYMISIPEKRQNVKNQSGNFRCWDKTRVVIRIKSRMYMGMNSSLR